MSYSSLIRTIFIAISFLFYAEWLAKVSDLSPYISFSIATIFIILALFYRKIFPSAKDQQEQAFQENLTPYELKDINIQNLSGWCEGWGKQYNLLNRIVVYAYPPQSELRYELYFEFDVFSKEGEKQSEAFNQGTWDYQYFPVHNDVEKFKNVYNEKPKDSTYINEWDFFSNTRDSDKEIPESVPSVEVYKKQSVP